MWRWMIRVYVAFILFCFMMFVSGVALTRIYRLFLWAGVGGFSRFVHAHVLLTMFLVGLIAGQVYLGSNFTGHGWFRSKSGLTYEGFKLEKIKPWTWLIVTPILLIGIVVWCFDQGESVTAGSMSISSFYHTFLASDCSNASFLGWKQVANLPCFMNLFFVGTWTASIGYSLAPKVRTLIVRRLRQTRIRFGHAADVNL